MRLSFGVFPTDLKRADLVVFLAVFLSQSLPTSSDGVIQDYYRDNIGIYLVVYK